MITQQRLETLKELYASTAPNLTLDLIAEIERLQKKTNTLHKAADAIADQIMEEQGLGAEYDEDGYLEVKLNKAEVEELISVILGWDK